MWLQRAIEFVDKPYQYTDRRYTQIHRQQIIDRININLGLTTMAAADKKRKGTTTKNEIAWRGFSNVPITESQRKDFIAWVEPDMKATLQADELCGNGYKMNLAYNDKNKAFSAAVTCTDPDSVNAGLTMTSLAPTCEYAIMLAYWKHFILCEEIWPEPNSSAGNSQWG